MQIEVEVKGQQIKRLNSPGSVEDTLNYLTCHFTFDGSEWENTIKTAYFKNRATEKIYSSLIADDGTCTVPWESLTDKGFVEFSAAGERENYRITTGIESFYNSKTVYGGEPSEPPTPSQYDQLIALAEQTKEIAESVREDADAGEFDGPPGPQGPAGKDGQNATDEQVRTAVDAYMEEHPIQGDTEDIIKLAIKNEASGAVPIAVTDSAEMGVQDIKMQGWTEQKRYEGKNLFDEARARTFESYTLGLSNYYDLEIPVVAGKTYIFNRNKINGYQLGAKNLGIRQSKNENVTLWLVHDKVEVLNHETIEITATGDTIVIATNITNQEELTRIFDECFLDAQLEEGTIATAYEPYTGGQPSPNPDYPQEITSAGKYDEGTGKYQYEVKLTGANLFNPDGEIVDGSPYDGIPLNNKGIVSMALYEKNPDVDVSNIYFGICSEELNSNDVIWALMSGTIQSGGKIICPMNNRYVCWYPGNDATLQKLLSRYDVMVNYGDGVYLPYQPYKEQTVTLTSDRPLTKWDKLEKRDGVWGWVYKSESYTVTGEEFFTSSVDTYHGEQTSDAWLLVDNMFSKVWIPSDDPGGYCEKLSWSQAIWEKDGNVGFTYNSNQIHIRLNNADVGITSEDTLTDIANKIKEYVGQQYQEGNPFIFWYETAEETFVPLSESEQEALNALRTYYPTTILDNDQGCDMALTYIADTKAYIDNKVSAIQATIVNTI